MVLWPLYAALLLGGAVGQATDRAVGPVQSTPEVSIGLQLDGQPGAGLQLACPQPLAKPRLPNSLAHTVT